MKEFNNAILEEEKFLKQKAKVEWLKEGDRNTKYFHRIIMDKQQVPASTTFIILKMCFSKNQKFQKHSWTITMLYLEHRSLLKLFRTLTVCSLKRF